MYQQGIKKVKSVSFLLLSVYLILMIVRYLTPVIENLINYQSGSAVLNRYIYTCILQLLLFLIPAVTYALMKKSSPQKMRMKGFKIKHLPFVAVLSLTVSIIVFVVNISFSMLINNGGAAVTQIEDLKFSNGAELVMMILAAVILPAIAEEFLVRGILLSEFESLGTVYAIVISAIAFSAMHTSFYNLPGHFFAGLVYGWLAYRMNSIIPVMIAHIVNNALAVYLKYFIEKNSRELQTNIIVLVIVAALAFLVLLYLTVTLTERLSNERKKETQYTPPIPIYVSIKAAFNLFFILFLVLWIINSVLMYINI